MDKPLSAVYLISSEWDMLQGVQFPIVVGFVDFNHVFERKPSWAVRKQNKNINK